MQYLAILRDQIAWMVDIVFRDWIRCSLSLPFGRKIIRRAAGQSGDSVERYERPAQEQPCFLRAREALLISSERGAVALRRLWSLQELDPSV